MSLHPSNADGDKDGDGGDILKPSRSPPAPLPPGLLQPLLLFFYRSYIESFNALLLYKDNVNEYLSWLAVFLFYRLMSTRLDST